MREAMLEIEGVAHVDGRPRPCEVTIEQAGGGLRTWSARLHRSWLRPATEIMVDFEVDGRMCRAKGVVVTAVRFRETDRNELSSTVEVVGIDAPSPLTE